MLKGNGNRRLNTSVCKMTGGNSVAGLYGLGMCAPRAFTLTTNGVLQNYASGEHTVSGVTNKSGVPYGYLHPGSWILPRKGGALGSFLELVGSGSITTTLIPAKNAVATLTGSGTLTATAQLVVSLVAALSGSGTISNANAVAFLQLAASLAGAGSVSAALAALAWASASLEGDGTLDASTLTAIGTLIASLSVTGGELTTGNVAEAVWGALAASNNDVGTMGEKLNDAGSASNPWTEVIESGYTAAEILRLIAAATQGAASGLEGASPKFRDIANTKDRIDASYSGGNRTINSRDAT